MKWADYWKGRRMWEYERAIIYLHVRFGVSNGCLFLRHSQETYRMVVQDAAQK